ncbi:hypothetical protein KP509_11G056800 [Ceratopteris richardii]|uniref:RNA helicase n=1 Tax=Ceratopteris richardii TaxID=49495 RepID=A0A8T2TVK7_CERRI|nr:hypothetical protein KP509_11G056800 [Ceratopteris richardii]
MGPIRPSSRVARQAQALSSRVSPISRRILLSDTLDGGTSAVGPFTLQQASRETCWIYSSVSICISTLKGSFFLHPRLSASGNVLPRLSSENDCHLRKFATSGLAFDAHVEEGLNCLIEVKGFAGNPEAVSHAAKLAININDSILEDFISCVLANGEQSIENKTQTIRDGSEGFADVLSVSSSGSTFSCPIPNSSIACSKEDDVMSFLEDLFTSQEVSVVQFFANQTYFPKAAPAFQGFVEENCTNDFRRQLQDLELSVVKQKVLFPMLVDFCNEHYPDELRTFQALLEVTDMTKPHALYCSARSFKRKVIYHYGPTNSGKTYSALQRFLKLSNGIYCSPLRLLAMEVYDHSNSKGVPCNLVTGQERKEEPFARHVSCTVEMASLQQVWKVAVIDEVQLLNDDCRGWAWTRALLGLQAEELHVCGDPSALPVVRSICSATGDDLEEHAYERFKPLAVDSDTLNSDLRNAQPGDCIIAFSRRQIFEIKRAVERATHKRCCVVYGALPPETRSQQAKLFNEPGNGYDILVASDAVGMGLNLNIKRVVFHTLHKFDGEESQQLPTPLIKQIAGRAGRRGSLFPEGLVTTFHASDLPILCKCLAEPFLDSCSAGLFPSCDQLQLFAKHMPDAKFSEVLECFAQTCRLDSHYFLCQDMALKKIASIIDTIDNLTLEESLIICSY